MKSIMRTIEWAVCLGALPRERAKSAADYTESWIWTWNLPMPVDADDAQLHYK